jgi:biopolymer transport protein TolQ
VVKAVMIGLLLASVWVWAIVFEKMRQHPPRQPPRPTPSRTASGPAAAWTTCTAAKASSPAHPIAAVFGAAMREWHRSVERLRGGSELAAAGTQERLDRAMNVTVQRQMDRMERWMVFLASVGSVAPFIGLFGTVWGIMNSFTAIAGMQNTNLAVVAPGIAEALFATAIGLVAAIPAVLAYNKISTDLSRFAARLEGFASEFGAILSRQTEAAAEPARAAAAAE